MLKFPLPTDNWMAFLSCPVICHSHMIIHQKKKRKRGELKAPWAPWWELLTGDHGTLKRQCWLLFSEFQVGGAKNMGWCSLLLNVPISTWSYYNTVPLIVTLIYWTESTSKPNVTPLDCLQRYGGSYLWSGLKSHLQYLYVHVLCDWVHFIVLHVLCWTPLKRCLISMSCA